MFAEQYEELETKAVKRQLKLDKQESRSRESLSAYLTKGEHQEKLFGKRSSSPITTTYGSNRSGSAKFPNTEHPNRSRLGSRSSVSPPSSKIASVKDGSISNRNLTNNNSSQSGSRSPLFSNKR